MTRVVIDRNRLAAAYAELLNELELDGFDGTRNTPVRATEAWIEMTAGYNVDVGDLFRTFEGGGYDELIAVTGIPFSSLCEHHLLPFSGKAHVVYLPDEAVMGLSKVPRLVDAYARRLQMQERLTQQIADAMMEHLAPWGVLVRLEAEHECATLRGVKKPGMGMVTQAIRGSLKEDASQRAEALGLIGASR